MKPIEQLQQLVQTALQDSTFVAQLQVYNEDERCHMVAGKVAHMLTDETLGRGSRLSSKLCLRESHSNPGLKRMQTCQ